MIVECARRSDFKKFCQDHPLSNFCDKVAKFVLSLLAQKFSEPLHSTGGNDKMILENTSVSGLERVVELTQDVSESSDHHNSFIEEVEEEEEDEPDSSQSSTTSSVSVVSLVSDPATIPSGTGTSNVNHVSAQSGYESDSSASESDPDSELDDQNDVDVDPNDSDSDSDSGVSEKDISDKDSVIMLSSNVEEPSEPSLHANQLSTSATGMVGRFNYALKFYIA